MSGKSNVINGLVWLPNRATVQVQEKIKFLMYTSHLNTREKFAKQIELPSKIILFFFHVAFYGQVNFLFGQVNLKKILI